MNNRRGIGRTFNKPKNRKYVIKRLADYMQKFVAWFILAFILMLVSNIFSLLGPNILGKAIGSMENGNVNFPNVFKYDIIDKNVLTCFGEHFYCIYPMLIP